METQPLVRSINSLFRIFSQDPEIPDFEELPGEEVPEPYRGLLAHNRHMTVTMEEFHGGPVAVSVVEKSQVANLYARKILLTSEKTAKVVQYGIMCFNFGYCTPEVREAILAEETPLGRILIEHGLLRRVDVLHLIRLNTGAEITRLLGLPEPAVTYGRLARLFCNERQAVELLEVAAPVG